MGFFLQEILDSYQIVSTELNIAIYKQKLNSCYATVFNVFLLYLVLANDAAP
jgi:hypothetical protein